MNKKKLLVLLPILLTVSCGGGATTSSIVTGSSETTSDTTETTKETTSITSGDIEEEVLALKNELKNLNLKGYVGTNLKNNVKYWQTSALTNNPNIITQIAEANDPDSHLSLSYILGTDYFGVDSYYDIDIHEEEDGTKRLGWTMKFLPGSFGDRDIRYSNDPDAITNWTGAKEMWIAVDNSEVDGISSLRVAFEDDSYGRESFALVPGKDITLINNSETITTQTLEGGYVDIPAHFKGYLIIPVNNEYYECYWSEGGNKRVEVSNIAQFQIALRGTSKNITRTFYIDNFAIVGTMNGDPLPVTREGNDKYKVVWDFKGVGPKKTDDKSQPSGLAWYGEFVGKLLTGIAFSYKATHDEALVTAANEIIDGLEVAQGQDGYLGVFKGSARFSIGASNWDLWNHYHAVVGLLEWYRITKNERALAIARKALDCIYETFKGKSYLVRGGFETNRGIAHGFALMYQITREIKYLEEAERIIINDCQDANGWYLTALRGGHFYRSSSARWEVLHMIMTLGILYEETEDEEYFKVMKTIFYDILETDIHNTGGFTTNEGAVGTPYREGVIETCCTIAWQAFSNEFYKIAKKVEIVDEIERSYYNGILGALLDDDKYCTYNTPMNGVQGSCGTYDGRRVKSQQDISFQFNSGSPDMNCCQANFARGLGQIAEWAILNENKNLYVNYFGNCSMETKILGKDITIKEMTNYPLDGDVSITIEGLSEPTEFNLKLRIPGWSKNSTITIDGNTKDVISGEYAEIARTWKNGDVINLHIGIGFTSWEGEKNLLGYSSIYRGPILLTLDEYYQNNSGFAAKYDDLSIHASDFKNAKISNGNVGGAWIYVDVPYGNDFIRLVDFASAGKYHGLSQPSSYRSWLSVEGVKSFEGGSAANRWKVEVYY